MRIAVFGAGGIGGYLGGRLAQAGEEVAVIARGEHLKAIREHGLTVDSIKGDFVFQPSIATDDPAEVGAVDVVILGVKAWQVTEAAEALRPMIEQKTCVLPIQNGVEAPSQLAAVLGEGAVLGGLGGLVSFIVGPGHIQHAAGEPFVKFGEMDNHPSPRTERLLQAFEQAGVQAEIPPNIQAALWQKLMFIAAISGVGAVTRVPAGVWRSLPETWEMAVQIARETDSVARGHGIPLVGGELDAAIAGLERASATVSMQRDIMEGRPSELEVQNGAVVRLGLEVGVPTPVNAFIYYSLLLQEMKARGQAP